MHDSLSGPNYFLHTTEFFGQKTAIVDSLNLPSIIFYKLDFKIDAGQSTIYFIIILADLQDVFSLKQLQSNCKSSLQWILPDPRADLVVLPSPSTSHRSCSTSRMRGGSFKTLPSHRPAGDDSPLPIKQDILFLGGHAQVRLVGSLRSRRLLSYQPDLRVHHS